MRLELRAPVCVRSWRADDEQALVRYANNRQIWRNMRDAFPHPYTLEDARQFLKKAASQDPEGFFCIAREEEAIGAIGYMPHADVERFTAEVGYWLAEPFWGQGIATEALRALTRFATETRGFHRLFASPYAWNPASCRVLEKAGYVLEGRLREQSFKDGQFVDQLLYAYVVG